MLLAPTAVWAQGTLRVLSVHGRVEWKAVSGTAFVPVTAATQQPIQPGDELRTGADAEITLEVPDGSYMVVSEHSKLIVEDFWTGNLRSMINLMMGRVRFYIQKLGGRPNPYSVRTPTALIAVRGTVFDVIVDEAQISEVRCFEGQVTVENIGRSDRQIILNPGFRTLVRPGEIPTMPVLNDVPDADANVLSSRRVLARDDDRFDRPDTQRAKPTLTFPR
jgi:hypothetical protein